MKIFFLICVVTCLVFANVNAQSGWTLQTNPLGSGNYSFMVGKVLFVSPTEGWISVSNGAKLLHTTNGGSIWSVVSMSLSDTVASLADPSDNISFINSTTGWVIKSFGTDFSNLSGAVVYKTTNGGVDWGRKIISQNSGDLGLQIQFFDVNNGLANVTNLNSGVSKIYKTTDGGDNWNVISSGSFRSFYFVDAMNGWAISLSIDALPPPYNIMRTTDGGVNWSTQYTDNSLGDFLALHIVDLANGWVVGRNVKVLKTTNGGTNWNFVTNTGAIPNNKLDAVFFLDSNNGWLGTRDNAGNRIIIHTSNGGANWNTQLTPVQHDIFSIFFWDVNNGWLTTEDGAIARFGTGVSVKGNDNSPNQFSLNQNYPNPFNPSTIIEYAIPQKGTVILKVYNLLGQEVATLVNEIKNAGTHTVEWNTDSAADGLTSGVYFYTLRTGLFMETKKLLLLK